MPIQLTQQNNQSISKLSAINNSTVIFPRFLTTTMVASKMTCKNNDKFMYTGKEMSPLGLGFCADSEKVGTQMIGRDGKDWIVGIKNGEKIWIRAPEKMVLSKEDPVLESASPIEETKKSEEKPKKKVARKLKMEEKPEEEEKPKKKATRKPKVVEEKAEDHVVIQIDEEKPTKKIIVRKAPAEKAGDFEEGEEKEGANGDMFVVKTDKNGTKKWMKKTSEKKEVSEENEKPKRKYTRKPKAENDDAVPKKERKKRGPTAYNLFIGAKLKELREKNPGKETTVYMREALDIWGALTKEEKEVISNNTTVDA